MTGSVAIDVAIGLIFIFLLYSLLASVLLEIFSTHVGIRGANLKRVIYQMLNDDDQEVKRGKRILLAFWSLVGRGTTQKRNGLAKTFYQSSAIKYLGTNGATKSSPSNISAQQFSKGLISVMLKESPNFRNQAEVVRNFITKEKENANQVSKSGIEHLEFLFNQAQCDLDKFTAKIEEWYEEMMLVATEWYKKRMQIWLFIIGLSIAVTFNVNTLYLVKILSNDKKARQEMVALASSYIEKNSSISDLDAFTKEELKAYKEELDEQIVESRNILGLSERMTDTLIIKDASCTPDELENALKNTSSYLEKTTGDYVIFEQPKGWKYLNFGKFINPKRFNHLEAGTKGISIKTGTTILSRIMSWSFDEYRLRYRMYNWFGAILTALAISLGAPFWFDLLNKIMQLRGAVSQKKAVSQASNKSSTTSDDNTRG